MSLQTESTPLATHADSRDAYANLVVTLSAAHALNAVERAIAAGEPRAQMTWTSPDVTITRDVPATEETRTGLREAFVEHLDDWLHAKAEMLRDPMFAPLADDLRGLRAGNDTVGRILSLDCYEELNAALDGREVDPARLASSNPGAEFYL